MVDFFSVLVIILPVIATLALGYLTKKRNIVAPSGIDGIRTVAVTYCLPIVIFGAFYRTQIGFEALIITVVILGVQVLGLLLGKLYKKGLKSKHELLPFLMCTSEGGGFGYGLYLMLFAQEHFTNFAIADISLCLMVNVIIAPFFMKSTAKTIGGKVVSLIKTPLMIAVLAGLVLGISGLGNMLYQSPVGEAIDVTIDYLGVPTGMLMIFVAGYNMVFSKENLRDAVQAAGLRALTLVGLGIVALGILNALLPLSYHMFWAIALIFTLPPTFVLVTFASKSKDVGFLSTTISLYTIVSVVFFVIIATITA